MGLSRGEVWSRLPFPPPRDLPDPGIEHASPALVPYIAGSFFTTKPLWCWVSFTYISTITVLLTRDHILFNSLSNKPLKGPTHNISYYLISCIQHLVTDTCPLYRERYFCFRFWFLGIQGWAVSDAFKRNAVSSQEGGKKLMMKGKVNISFCNNAGSLTRTDCCISWIILLVRRRDGGRMNKVAFIFHLSVIQPQNINSCLGFWVLYMWEQNGLPLCPTHQHQERKTQGTGW